MENVDPKDYYGTAHSNCLPWPFVPFVVVKQDQHLFKPKQNLTLPLLYLPVCRCLSCLAIISHQAKKTAKNSKAVTAAAEDIMGRVGAGAQANAGVAAAKGLQGVRMTTENFALDSFENLIFSLARFREFTGKYPLRITVVGYGMKEARFEELHAKAIRWPVKGYYSNQRQFHYVGIDDEGDNQDQYDGEKIKGYKMFERDMYGCHGTLQVSGRGSRFYGVSLMKSHNLLYCIDTNRPNEEAEILLVAFTVTLVVLPKWQIY
jgi:hypothetical protein